MSIIAKLQAKYAAAVKAARDLSDHAMAEDRDLTEEEQGKVEALLAESKRINAAIEREKLLQAAEGGVSNEASLEVAGADVRVTGGEERRHADPRGGFQSYGEFCSAVFRAGRRNAELDPRLVGAAPTSFANESSGADGGFLVPPEFSAEIRRHALEEGAFLPMTDNVPVGGNSMTFPADETTPWGSTGVRAYWEAEGAQASQTKPVVNSRTLRLNKLFALVPVTDELLADTMALSGYLTSKTGESIRWKTNDSLVNGNGSGKPQGVRVSPALVTQTKTGSQTADTINADNVLKMYARNTNPGRAVWLINPDAWNQLPQMTIGDQPVFTTNVQGTPGGVLLGRPVYMTDTLATLGDAGDVMFVDWKSYLTITKQAGIEYATSMHLWFDYDITAFRATFRLDGQGWLQSAVTPPNSSVTRSPFVTLEART